MTDIEKCIALLKGDKTCVLIKGENTIVSDKKGISPVMELIEKGINLEGFSVADKIVGKAVAMLFKKVGIKEIFAEVLSERAKNFLEENNIKFSYNTLTKEIINRQATGICPMEETVLNIESIEDAYVALKQKLSKLKAQK